MNADETQMAAVILGQVRRGHSFKCLPRSSAFSSAFIGVSRLRVPKK
jgi:hypothetical protein